MGDGAKQTTKLSSPIYVCIKVTDKFKLFCMTYGMPREVRYDKGPQFSSYFEEFLRDIKVEPKLSSIGIYSSNGLAEAAVGNTKLLIRKCLEDKVNFAEQLCYFNMCPREDGYSPSKIMHGRRIRSLLSTLDDKINITAAKAAREKTDLIIKTKKQTSKPSPPLSLVD